MSAQVTIAQLPTAGAITGSELVPVVQNGVTVQTTTGAIAGSPTQTYTYLTVNQTPQLPNSRYVGATNGLTVTDGGAQGVFNITSTGALSSLVSSGTGLQVKTSSTSITGRSVAFSGSGIAVTNGDGIAGNPTVSLTGQVLSLANLSGNGLMTVSSGGVLNAVSVVGTANQIDVTNGNGIGGAPTIAIANNVILPGTGAATLPKGTDVQRPVGVTGQIRFNTTTGVFEGYTSGSWLAFAQGNGVVTFDGGTTGLTPALPTNGAISLGGTLVVANGGTGANTLSGYLKGNGISAISGVATIPSTDITGLGTMSTQNANAVAITGGTISGLSAPLAVASGGTGAATLTGYVKGTGTSALTASSTIPNTDITGLGSMSTQSSSFVAISGGAINGTTIGSITPAAGSFTSLASTSATVNSDAVTTNTASQTITNKTISGASNTISNIGNSSLTNSAITINGNSVSLGGSTTVTATASNALTIGTGLSGTSYNGSTPVTVAIDSTVATLAGSQTLTNKTLTSPTVNTPILSGGTINNAIIGATVPAAGTFTSVTMTTGTITTAPSTGNDIVNKTYVDGISAGLNFHQSCRLATTTALPANTYNNGASGVGATLTANANGALSVDSTLTVAGNRVLVKNEAAGANNGVYTVTQVGTAGTPYILTRATDYNTAGTGVNQIDAGDFFLVTAGTVNSNTSWVQQTPLPITVGTTTIVFQQFGAPIAYSAGTGLTESPSYTFNIGNTGVTANTYGSASSVPQIGVNAQGQITSASNVAIAINGNQITSGTVGSTYISGAYANITGVGILASGTWNASTIGVAYGGTGATTLTGYVKGSGTSALTASATIPNTDISGLGTMSTQNANSVTITGGTVNGTVIGGTTAAAGSFTTVTATGGISGGTF